MVAALVGHDFMFASANTRAQTVAQHYGDQLNAFLNKHPHWVVSHCPQGYIDGHTWTQLKHRNEWKVYKNIVAELAHLHAIKVTGLRFNLTLLLYTDLFTTAYFYTDLMND